MCVCIITNLSAEMAPLYDVEMYFREFEYIYQHLKKNSNS